MADQNQNTQQEGGNDAPSFNLQRVYLKDLSLEMPNAPHVFLEQEAPQVEVSIAVGGQRLADTVFETTVTVTVTTRINDKVVYRSKAPRPASSKPPTSPKSSWIRCWASSARPCSTRTCAPTSPTRSPAPRCPAAPDRSELPGPVRAAPAELAQQQGSANGNGANGDSGIILPPARPASNADPRNPRDRPMTASASPSLRVAVLGAGSWAPAAASRRHPVLWARDAAQASARGAAGKRTLPARHCPAAGTAIFQRPRRHARQPAAGRRRRPDRAGRARGRAGRPLRRAGKPAARAGPARHPHRLDLWALKPAPPACRTRSCAKLPQAQCGVLSGPSFAREVAQACRWR